ncbi:MAG TPA: hypothetical protein VIX63_10225 [Vicinamibacterales bacterium]
MPTRSSGYGALAAPPPSLLPQTRVMLLERDHVLPQPGPVRQSVGLLRAVRPQAFMLAAERARLPPERLVLSTQSAVPAENVVLHVTPYG